MFHKLPSPQQQDEGQDEGELITDEIVAVKREIGDIADEIEDEVGKEVDDDKGKKDSVEKQESAKRQKPEVGTEHDLQVKDQDQRSRSRSLKGSLQRSRS